MSGIDGVVSQQSIDGIIRNGEISGTVGVAGVSGEVGAQSIAGDVEPQAVAGEVGSMTITINAASLDDLLTAIRGAIIRGGVTSWEILDAKTARAVVIGDGTDVISRALELADLPGIALTDLSDVDGDGVYSGSITLRGDLHLDGDFTNYNTQALDIGAVQDSDKRGYGDDYITDKRISHSTIGDNDQEVDGAIRFLNGIFQVYANDTWNDAVIGFVLREDADTGELEHQPIGYSFYYEVMSGNSNLLGIDGKPIVQQYTSSMGAYQLDMVISGGTF